MGGAGGPRDALVHQGAAQVVHAGVETGPDPLRSHLDPGGLDVSEPGVERQAGHRVHQNRLAEGRPLAGAALEVERRLHVDEGERHELGEAAGPFLQVAQPEQVPGPVPGAFDVAVHDRRRCPIADAVGGFHDLEPLVGVQLVGADDRADLVVQDLGGGPREGAESGVPEPEQVVAKRHVERRRALPDLERRKGVDVDLGHRFLHRAADAQVGLAGVVGVDAALHADFRRAALPGLDGATHDLFEFQVVGLAAQVLAQLALGEGAELALEVADVRVVDVPVDDVGHRVAVHFAPDRVRGGADGGELRATCGEQPGDLVLREVLARLGPFEDGSDACRYGVHSRAVAVRGGGARHRRENLGRRRSFLTRGPVVGAGEAGGVEPLQHRRADAAQPADLPALAAAVIEPAFPVERPLRVHRQSLDQRLAGGGRLFGQPLQVRPGRLRVDEVGSHGRYAAPVVDAGIDEPRQHAGAQVGRRLDVHLRAQHQPRRGDRPEQVLQGGLGRAGHPGLRLGPEVLDDDFLDVAVLVVQVAHGKQGVDPFLAGLADPDQDARSEGHARFAREPQGLEPSLRHLVRATVVRLTLLVEPHGNALEHDAHGRSHRPQMLKVFSGHQPRVEVRQEARLEQDPLRRLPQVGKGGLVAQLGQAVTGGLVAQFRLVAEGEQRFLATGLGGKAGLAQHGVKRHVSRLALLRRLGEDAVVADVPAQVGQRQEDLAGVRNEVAVAAVSQLAGDVDQSFEAAARLDAGKRTGLVRGRTTIQKNAEWRGHEDDGGRR